MSVMGMTKNIDKKDIYSYIILKDQRIIWTIKGKIISFLFFLIKVDKIMKVEISLYRIYSRTKKFKLDFTDFIQFHSTFNSPIFIIN